MKTSLWVWLRLLFFTIGLIASITGVIVQVHFDNLGWAISDGVIFVFNIISFVYYMIQMEVADLRDKKDQEDQSDIFS